jgi:hypothetical protein
LTSGQPHYVASLTPHTTNSTKTQPIDEGESSYSPALGTELVTIECTNRKIILGLCGLVRLNAELKIKKKKPPCIYLLRLAELVATWTFVWKTTDRPLMPGTQTVGYLLLQNQISYPTPILIMV